MQDVFSHDLGNLLVRYSEAVKRVLAAESVGVITPKANADSEKSDLAASNKLGEAFETYTQRAAKEQQRWLLKHSELAAAKERLWQKDINFVARCREENVAVRRMEAAAEAHCTKLAAELRASKTDEAARSDPVQLARQDWTKEVVRSTLETLNREWTAGHALVLKKLGAEMLAERQAVADALATYATLLERMVETSQSVWASELQGAEQQADKLTQALSDSLRHLLQGDLQEMRRHRAEQAEFFTRELAKLRREVDQAEANPTLEQTRSALTKWQAEWMLDVQQKVSEARLSVSKSTPAPLSAAAEAERIRSLETALQEHWDREQVTEEEMWQFLTALEQEIPSCPEILQLYEEHLTEFGILAPLEGFAAVAAERAQSMKIDAHIKDHPPPVASQRSHASPSTSRRYTSW